MSITIKEKEFENIIMVGDRILIKPKTQQERTDTGLYLPPSVEKKQAIHSGYIIKVGPGYPIPAINDYDEPWKDKSDNVKYVPLQPKIGDLAVYLPKSAFDIKYKNEKYLIVPHSAILMLIRDEGLLE